jgi:hypothetical protein
LFLAPLLICILSGAAAHADSTQPISISSVRFGLPPGPFAKPDEDGGARPLFKGAAWAPIQIALDFDVAAPMADEEIEIIVSTPDGDDVVSQAHVRMPAPGLGRAQGVPLPRNLFLKPGGIYSEVSVQVVGATSRQPLAETVRQRFLGLQPSQFLLLSCGAALPGVRLPKAEGQSTEAAPENGALRNGWVQISQVTNVDDLPDRWFGFDAVDLLILDTGDAKFWQALAAQPRRGQALTEWVRRGGRVIIAGQAALRLRDDPRLQEMLPVRVGPDAQAVDEIAMVLPNSPRLLLRSPEGKVPLVALKPSAERPAQIKLLADEINDAYPLVVQAPYGLGRVTLVAFDLDRPPFEEWTHRAIFWEWLINLAGTRLPNGLEPLAALESRDDDDKYEALLQNNLEFFEGVPVVSFGWVALLILLYIVIIGPLEYVLLQKVFKRLEFTWLTFPVIVALSCAAAWLAAVDLKGNELKTNKIDLVEVDLAGKRAFGQTWFTVFSPRIQNFTIGIEPLLAQSAPQDMLVTWQGRAKNARQSLFRRAYSYHSASEPDAFADWLDEVPIQVWSTKAFTAQWAGRPERPLFESTLQRAAADPSQLTGSITSHWPGTTIEDAQLFYRERSTPVPPLVPGMPRYLSTSPQAASVTTWLQGQIVQKDLILQGRQTRGGVNAVDAGPQFRLWPMLFHDAVQGQFGRLFNSSVRELDQSWRIGEKSTNEAILVARLRCVERPAEELSNAPGMPTRLSLRQPPAAQPRLPLEGSLRQETYVRVFIPIPPGP